MVKVHLVMNGFVLAVYRDDRRAIAEAHARTVTGAIVHTLDVLDRMPISVEDDIMSDDWDEVTPINSEPGDTHPDTPRAKLRRKPTKK
jgi:hypothetical protein